MWDPHVWFISKNLIWIFLKSKWYNFSNDQINCVHDDEHKVSKKTDILKGKL